MPGRAPPAGIVTVRRTLTSLVGGGSEPPGEPTNDPFGVFGLPPHAAVADAATAKLPIARTRRTRVRGATETRCGNAKNASPKNTASFFTRSKALINDISTATARGGG